MSRGKPWFVSQWITITLIGLLLLSVAAAIPGLAAPSTYEWEDDFETTTLNGRWFWLNEDQPWSLTDRPGYLRITIQPTGQKNHLLQLAPPGDFEIETKLAFTPTNNFQFAGLYVYENGDNFMAFGRALCTFCIGNAIYFDFIEAGEADAENFATTFDPPGDTYLKIVRQGTTYSGYLSENGTDWTLIGTHNSALKHAFIGLVAANQVDGTEGSPADFDYFKVRDDAQRLYLPLLNGAEMSE